MNVVQINSIEFEDILDGVYKLEKRLDKIDEKLSGRSIEYVPLNQVLKTLGISRKTADNWHKQKILSKKYIGDKVSGNVKGLDKEVKQYRIGVY